MHVVDAKKKKVTKINIIFFLVFPVFSLYSIRLFFQLCPEFFKIKEKSDTFMSQDLNYPCPLKMDHKNIFLCPNKMLFNFFFFSIFFSSSRKGGDEQGQHF